MYTQSITSECLANSVVSVPPLARDVHGKISTTENRKLIQYLEQGGVSTLLYGGNAVLYHIRMKEYAELLQLLCDTVAESTWVIPSVGPAYGTMMDQLDILRDFDFPTAMVLPQKEVCDAKGISTGLRRFVDSYGKPIVLYLKHDRWLPPSIVRSMVDDGLISWIKYAVVRDDPSNDDYLREILDVIPGNMIVSGIGEQPAIVHLRDFGVIGFTSGCVCVAPALSMEMLRAIQARDFSKAESIRQQFRRLEDLRNNIQPIRVLHHAVAAAGISATGPIQPLLGELSPDQIAQITAAAAALRQLETPAVTAAGR